MSTHTDNIAFIGGGSIARFITGGLLKRGLAVSQRQVVEPLEEQRIKIKRQFGVAVHAATGQYRPAGGGRQSANL